MCVCRSEYPGFQKIAVKFIVHLEDTIFDLHVVALGPFGMHCSEGVHPSDVMYMFCWLEPALLGKKYFKLAYSGFLVLADHKSGQAGVF